MTLDPRLFADGPVRDARFEVKDLQEELLSVWDDQGHMVKEFLHRQMNEEVNGLEIAARNLADFPDAPWDLRMAIARQCWDEARHVSAFRRYFEARGGKIGEYAVINFEYRMAMALPTLVGRLAVQNRSFEAAGIQAIHEAIDKAREAGEEDLLALFDAQLADEIQHVRYANIWVKELIERDPRAALDVVRSVSQASQAFAIIAGNAIQDLSLGDDMLREAGFLEEPAAR